MARCGWVCGGRCDLGGPVGRGKPSATQGLVPRVNRSVQSVSYGCDWPCMGSHTFSVKESGSDRTVPALSSQIVPGGRMFTFRLSNIH